MDRLKGWALRLRLREEGATAVEYALILAFIFCAIVAAVAAFGTAVRGLFELVPPL
jgi:Flp pilus assembly pilin Flp